MADDDIPDFVELPFPGFDPDDFFTLHRVASGRAGYFEDEHDVQTSTRHRVGHFWVVEPRHGNPDFISYLDPFADAPRGPSGALEYPLVREEMDRAWAAMDQPGQHLTPHHRAAYEGRSSGSFPHGSVHFDPGTETWTIYVAASLAGKDELIGEVRQRFVVEQTMCRIIPLSEFEGEER